MNDLNSLSLADLKAASEYVEMLKKERIEDLKSQTIDIKTDKILTEFDKLEFDIHNQIFSRINKLRKQSNLE